MAPLTKHWVPEAWAFALLSMLLAFGAVLVAGQAWSRSNDAKDAAAAATGTTVSFSEFKIDPSIIAVAARAVPSR